MKHIFKVAMIALATLAFVACGSGNDPQNPKPENPEGPAFIIKYHQGGNLVDVTSDMTIQVSGINEDTGSIDLDGVLINQTEGVLDIDVDVTRGSAGYDDQLCVGMCIPGNGEKTQTFSFTNLKNVESEMFAHLIPTEKKKYTIEYFFHEKDQKDGIKFTVIYNNEE